MLTNFQVNSEHCRHKVFRATWTIDGEDRTTSLFDMIKNTYRHNPEGVLSAYSDNGAVLAASRAGPEGPGTWFMPDPALGAEYTSVPDQAEIVIKVETHNHPTAVCPFPGAATGSGGEIRDEGAVGIGAKPKAGLCGFMTSHLHLPGRARPWEAGDAAYGRPARIASALDIMIDGPLGAAAFNNEFGRPNLTGFFRTFWETVPAASAEPENAASEARGYHKPIMLAGGLGNIRPNHVAKKGARPGSLLCVLGGPCLLIGLGGGAASSVSAGASSEELDFASVQRDNAEMQRRAQEVISACVQLGDANPIQIIHDVGAGVRSRSLASSTRSLT